MYEFWNIVLIIEIEGGSEIFDRNIKEKFIEGRDQDRELSALRNLIRRPDIDVLKVAVEKFFPESGRLVRMAVIYLCRRLSGANLKKIENL